MFPTILIVVADHTVVMLFAASHADAVRQCRKKRCVGDDGAAFFVDSKADHALLAHVCRRLPGKIVSELPRFLEYAMAGGAADSRLVVEGQGNSRL